MTVHPNPPKPRADVKPDTVRRHSLPSGPHCHFLPETRGSILSTRGSRIKHRKCQLPRWFGNFPEYEVPATEVPPPRRTWCGQRWRNNGLCTQDQVCPEEVGTDGGAWGPSSPQTAVSLPEKTGCVPPELAGQGPSAPMARGLVCSHGHPAMPTECMDEDPQETGAPKTELTPPGTAEGPDSPTVPLQTGPGAGPTFQDQLGWAHRAFPRPSLSFRRPPGASQTAAPSLETAPPRPTL